MIWILLFQKEVSVENSEDECLLITQGTLGSAGKAIRNVILL